MPGPFDDLTHESLEIGAAPVVAHFLDRLWLRPLLEQHLPTLPGRPPALPSATILCVLTTNLLLSRQPLYALPAWAVGHVSDHLGLSPDHRTQLNDDRVGRALDHLDRADRASLLSALVRHAVGAFEIRLDELHQDTTTVTFSGDYAAQAPAERADRAPRITPGYNKDHRPDLKQLLFGISITDDGAVPVHAKVYDGNTTDDAVHIDTWSFFRELRGDPNFLYVADSKLCTRDNMAHIADRGGRFLTVMPRARAEDRFFRDYLSSHPIDWEEVHREPNPRRGGDPDVVYDAVEGPRRPSEGYRVLWYRSSQKRQQDPHARQQRLGRARARLEALHAPGRRRAFAAPADARAAAARVLAEEKVEGLLVVEVVPEVEVEYQQVGPGRPGPNTEYRRVEHTRYRVRFAEDPGALVRHANGDGLFPLMTNDERLTLAQALTRYKYQPFVEKRHEQLKSVFDVMPVWLKKPERVAALLWLYFVVELVQALVEREVRRQMTRHRVRSLALYPEGRPSDGPTTAVVFRALDGLRRHRLLDEAGQELRRFYDPLPDAAREALGLLGVPLAPYGLT